MEEKCLDARPSQNPERLQRHERFRLGARVHRAGGGGGS